MQHIPREIGWIQHYILTKILNRPVNLNFSKSGGCRLFIKKPEDFSLNRDNGLQTTL